MSKLMLRTIQLAALTVALIFQALPAPTAAAQPRHATQTQLVKNRTAQKTESISLTATVNSQVAGLSGTVEFEDLTTRLGRANLVDVDGQRKATLDIATLSPGMHLVYARYLGNDEFLGSISPAVEVFVRGHAREESD